jgi:hypothetical protein
MRSLSKSYTLKCALVCGLVAPIAALAQGVTAPTGSPGAPQRDCSAVLGDNSGVSAAAPDSAGGAAGRRDSVQTRTDTAGFGIGGARTGQPDVILRVAVQADQVTFAKQPNVRVRLCWGGDTLRVVQRTNIPSPVVAGTTYRNVYVAVELLGRLNGECLANAIGVGSTAQSQPRSSTQNAQSTSASNCAFLGGAAGAGTQPTGPPNP